MPDITVRNIPEEVHRLLRDRASKHGRSIEAEIRSILEVAVKAEPKDRIKLGSMLADIGRKIGLTDSEIEQMESARDKSVAKPVSFE